MKKMTSLLLLMAMLASLASCGGEKTSADETTISDDTGTSVSSDDPEYVYPELDCSGDEFTFLNLEPTWDMYTYLDLDSLTGEIVDDAVYDRNRALEERFNFSLKVAEFPIDELITQLRTTVSAGDDTYDAAYIRGENVAGAVSNGFCKNLYDIPGLNLDEPWWNQSVVREASLGRNCDSLYFIQSDLSLCAFDLVWSIFFNEDMMTDLGKDMPYDTVRAGKWTIDSFNTMLKWGTNLNGDESFAFSYDNKSIYGFTSFYRICDAMIVGAGNKFTTKDSDGTPVLSLENDRFYTTAEKLAKIFGTEGDYIEANQNGVSYDKIFMAGRALFYGGEVKASGKFRDMDDNFGILPLPKLDESQENYCAWMNYDTPTLVIPSTNSNPERTGAILDALSYLSYKDVLPAYYKVRVSQKSLRNDDSIEMLGIIRDSLYYDASLTYGWTATLAGAIRTALISGDSGVASIVASNKDAVEKKIAETMKTLEK